MIDNLRCLFFTTENRVDLMSLTLKYFLKFNKNLKISVAINKIPINKVLPYSNQIEYLDGQTDIKSDKTHFTNTLKNVLPKIKEDYIFYFCDDYFLMSDINVDDLNKLMRFIDEENIDYFGFEEVGCGEMIETEPYISNNYPFDKNSLRIKNNNYRYLYSVQPTIWKKKSLFDLSSKFLNHSIHNIDETLSHIKKSNTFKCICNTLKSHYTYEHSIDNYFIIAYAELTRHGVFLHPDNGCPVTKDILAVKLIDKLIHEENILQKPEFLRFFI